MNLDPIARMVGPGTRLGSYEVVEELGRGGAGVVYRGRHLTEGVEVALKVLLPLGRSSEARLKRFEREADALARMQHPSIVRIFERGQIGDCPFFAMDLVVGEPLSRTIQRGPLSIPRAVEIARDLASGLQHAHEKGILHRDIKPDNVLLDASGAPRLTDFGLVRNLDLEQSRLTKSGTILGTPHYMSPEQVDGLSHSVTGAADTYSLGVVLFEMLTGRRPFTGESPLQLRALIVQASPPRPSSLRAGIGRELDAIVLRALAKRAEDRPQTVGDMGDALDRCLRTGEAIAQPGPGPFVPALIGLLALAGVGLIAVTWLRSTPDRDSERATPPPLPTPTGSQEPGIDAAAQDPAALTERAALLLRLGEWDRAIAELEQALRLDPQHGSAYLLLAELHLRQVRLDAAVEALYLGTQQVTNDPTMERRLRRRFEVVAMGARRFEAVRRYAEGVLEAHPDDPDALGLLGDATLGAGSEEEAVRLWDRCLEQHPRHMETWERKLRFLVDVHPELGRAELARFSGAADGSPVALAYLSRYYAIGVGDLPRALQLAEQATRTSPPTAQAWLALATVRLLQGTPSDAHPAARKAVALDPGDWEPHYIKAQIEQQLGLNEAAISSIREGMRISPFDAPSAEAGALFLLEAGQLVECVELSRWHLACAVAAGSRQSPLVKLYQLDALGRLGRLPEAQSLADELVQTPRLERDAGLYLAQELADLQRFPEARELASAVLREHPGYTPAIELLRLLPPP